STVSTVSTQSVCRISPSPLGIDHFEGYSSQKKKDEEAISVGCHQRSVQMFSLFPFYTQWRERPSLIRKDVRGDYPHLNGHLVILRSGR
ncbi:hypothetical protein PMAYCL1PPCAC_23433, partial [Pristionchus mayeri]